MYANRHASSVPESPGKTRAKIQVALLITDIDWLVTCDRDMNVLTNGALAVRDDRIVAVGNNTEIASTYTAHEQLSLQGHMVLPGLINTHTHGAMSLFRGLADDLPLERWLHDVIFPAEAKHMNADLVYLGTLLSVTEMILSGTTTFCDGYFFEERAAKAAVDAGCRAIAGQGILDFPSPDLPDPAQARDRLQAFVESFPGDGFKVRPSLFCHAPYTCSAATLQWVKQWCRDKGWLFQIHLSETEKEVAELTKQFGEHPVFYLDRLGILDPHTLCPHAVWLTPDEIELLASRGAKVSHNVESNMKLAAGIAPVVQMLEAGITVALGTDSCASNNNLDLFLEMDRVAKIHKVVQENPTVMPAREVLHMATLKGAAALGMDGDIGSLEVGKKADFIAVDLNQPHLTPIYDPVSLLVYAARGSDVRHVWIDGTSVVRNARLVTVDQDALIKDVNAVAKNIR